MKGFVIQQCKNEKLNSYDFNERICRLLIDKGYDNPQGYWGDATALIGVDGDGKIEYDIHMRGSFDYITEQEFMNKYMNKKKIIQIY